MKYVFNTESGIRYRFPNHSTDLIVDRSEAACSEVFIVMMAEGSANHFHRHPETEQVFHILEGAGILTIGEERSEIPIKERDVVRIPPGTLHSVRATDARGIRYLCVDCFIGGVPAERPTWDAHIKAVCAAEGWDFARTRLNP